MSFFSALITANENPPLLCIWMEADVSIWKNKTNLIPLLDNVPPGVNVKIASAMLSNCLSKVWIDRQRQVIQVFRVQKQNGVEDTWNVLFTVGKMEEGIECEGDWHIITKLPDKFELKMLQLQLLLPECLWCHSLKMVNVSVWPRTFGRINLVLAEGQNWALNLVSCSLWLKKYYSLSWIAVKHINLPLNLLLSPRRQCWTVQWSAAKHPTLSWRVWGQGPAMPSRWGPGLWPATAPTARTCSSKHSPTVSGWTGGWLKCVEVCVYVCVSVEVFSVERKESAGRKERKFERLSKSENLAVK